jgi:hypothetical protein
MQGQPHQKNPAQNAGTQFEFNFEHLCWVEICWIENLEIGGHWQAFCIAGEDLGLDITSQDATEQDQLDQARQPRETADKTPMTRTSTPSTASEASAIQVQSPAPQRGSDQIIALQLAESLHIQEPVMSRTMTMEPPAGTINPHMGHMEMPMNPDDVALYRAIGPDQPDPQPTENDKHPQEYLLVGHEVDKDLEEGHSEDHREEEDCPEVEDYQEDTRCLCLKHHNKEDTMGTSWWEIHPSSSQGTAQKRSNSSPNGNYMKESTSPIHS